VVILSAPDGTLGDGDVVAWLLPWFAHAPNGATATASTATAKDLPFFMGGAYPDLPKWKRLRMATSGAAFIERGAYALHRLEIRS
jgi:hypothetical protein